jgi:hypothetical protein
MMQRQLGGEIQSESVGSGFKSIKAIQRATTRGRLNFRSGSLGAFRHTPK